MIKLSISILTSEKKSYSRTVEHLGVPSMRMFRIRNTLVREAAAEFFGTFILMVGIRGLDY